MSEKVKFDEELKFAQSLIKPVLDLIRPSQSLSMLHVCRGNYTRDEEGLLEGSYAPLSDFFEAVAPDMLTLEFSTPRAGELKDLFRNEHLADHVMLGLGVVNPRTDEIESIDSIVARVEEALAYLPVDRIWLNPDCGFATFSNRPMNQDRVIAKKMRALSQASQLLRDKYA